MLLFEEDLERRQEITANFLEAQSLIGLKQLQPGSELLRRVLHDDKNHIGAIDMMRTLEI